MPALSARRLLRPLLLAPLLAAFALLPAPAQPAETPAATQPFPTLDAGMHTAMIRRFAVDRAGRYGVSASDDKTARVWDLQDGRLLQTLRVPVGPGDEGKLNAVAISPDGATVAVGGWVGPDDAGLLSVYFFERHSGRIVGRIAGLPEVVLHLAWSPDGQRLALALGGSEGIRVHSTRPPFGEIARDANYDDQSYSVDFDRAGRLVSTAWDGKLRLYDAALRLIVPPRSIDGGSQPYAARFSPDGRRIAVGFLDSKALRIVSGRDLAPLKALDTDAADGGDLGKVAWSADGRRVYGSGTTGDGTRKSIRSFDPGSGRALAAWPVATNTVMDLQPLADGRVVFATAEPGWGIVNAGGQVGAIHQPPGPDHRGNISGFGLSSAADRLAFTHETWQDGRWQREALSFELDSLTLARDAEVIGLAAPRRFGLEIANWQNSPRPALAGQALLLKPHEISRSLGIAADASHFALGTDWNVRWFAADGSQAWETPVPSIACLVNASADGRFVVAALADGTIRWYRTLDGSEALALFVHADARRWVAWTPEGFFATSSPEAEGLLGYTVNQGRDKEAVFVSAAQMRGQFWRPELINARIAGDEAPIAAALKETGDVRTALADGLPPEVKLRSVKPLGNGDYALEVEITPRSGGLGRLVVVVDGVEQSTGREPPADGISTLRLSAVPGAAQVALKVYDRNNRLFSATPPTNVKAACCAK